MCKWTVQASAQAKATPQAVWQAWSSVESWNQWNAEIESSSLKDTFVVNSKGTVKPKGWPASTFVITHLQLNEYFKTDTKLIPFTHIAFEYQVQTQADKTVLITHKARVSGLFAPLLYLTMRKNLKKGLEVAVRRFAEHVERSNSTTSAPATNS